MIGSSFAALSIASGNSIVGNALYKESVLNSTDIDYNITVLYSEKGGEHLSAFYKTSEIKNTSKWKYESNQCKD